MLISERFVDNEIPAGVVDGANKVFTLNYAPAPVASLNIHMSGVLATMTDDYTLSGNTITFVEAPSVGSILRIFHRY